MRCVVLLLAAIVLTGPFGRTALAANQIGYIDYEQIGDLPIRADQRGFIILDDAIGKGSFSQVYAVHLDEEDDKKYALKVFHDRQQADLNLLSTVPCTKLRCARDRKARSTGRWVIALKVRFACNRIMRPICKVIK